MVGFKMKLELFHIYMKFIDQMISRYDMVFDSLAK